MISHQKKKIIDQQPNHQTQRQSPYYAKLITTKKPTRQIHRNKHFSIQHWLDYSILKMAKCLSLHIPCYYPLMTLFPTIFTIRRVVKKKKLIRPLLIPTQVTVDTMGTIKGLTKGCERVPFEGLIACSFQIWRDFWVFFAVVQFCMCVCVNSGGSIVWLHNLCTGYVSKNISYFICVMIIVNYVCLLINTKIWMWFRRK